MMNQQSAQLSSTQFTFLIYKTQIGFSVLVLPRILIQAVDTDGWLVLLLGFVIAVLMGSLILYIMRQHPDETLFDLLPRYVGKWIAKVMIVIWIVYTLFAATVGIFTSIYLIQIWILPTTPAYLLMIVFLIPIYMVTCNGITVIGRFAELVYLVSLLMPVLLFFSLKDVEWLNLLPILKEGWEPIIKNIPLVFPGFYGFELAFIWYPFLQQKKAAFKGMLIGNLLTLNIFLIVVLICFIKFSRLENAQMVWPSLNLLRLIQFPFLERLEVVFLSFYLYVLFATVIPYLFVAWFGIKKIVGKTKTEDGKVYLVLMMVGWLIGSFVYSLTYNDLEQMQQIMGQFALWIVFYFTFALASLLFVVHWWKRVKTR